MSKVLNGVAILGMVWVIFSGFWEVFTSGDLSNAEIQGMQMFGGFDHIAAGVGILAIFFANQEKVNQIRHMPRVE